MVKRNLSLAFFFALSLIIGIIIVGKYKELSKVLLFIAVLASSFGILFLTHYYGIFPGGHSLLGLYLIAAALGLITAYSAINFSPEYINYLGTDYREVSEYVCTAEEDSYRIAVNKIRFKAVIRGIETPEVQYSEKALGRVLVTVKGYDINKPFNGDEKVGYGETLRIKGTLKNSRIPGINYFSYIAPKDITYVGFSGPLSEMRFNLLKKVSKKIDLLGYPESELLRALFLGIKDEIPEDIMEGFEKTGTLHILALSGLHAGIIFLLVSLALFWLPDRTVRFIIASSILVIYVLLVGFRTSLVRASLMIFIGGFAAVFKRDSMPLNILSLAAIGTVLIEPFSVFTLSFQLSFTAVFGIITIGKIISVYLEPYLPGFLRYSLSAALGAQLAAAPILLYRFGIFYFIGFAASMLTIPIITLFIWSGILFILLPAAVLPFVQRFFSEYLGFLYNVVNYINKNLSEIPGIVVKTEKEYIIGFIVITILGCVFLLPRKFICIKGENV